MLPVMVLAVAETRPRHWAFKVTLAYSFFWGFLGGVLPALVYDRTVWSVFRHILANR